VLFFGTYDASTYPRIAVLEEGFRAHGDEVVVCNEPLRVPTSVRVRMLRKPWLSYVLLLELARCWSALVWRARKVGHVDVVVVGYMGQFDVHLARMLWPRVPVVLDHLVPAGEAAVDRRCGSRLVIRLLRFLDWAATRTADVVCVDTRQHLALAGRRGGVVAPVGASDAWFAAPREHAAPPLKVIFFGSFTPLQGAPVIAAAAKMLEGSNVEFTIVGRGQDWDASRQAAASSKNVTWLDWIEPVLLPAVVAEHDVCLGIFGTSAKALSVVPTKVFQGAAAGAAIVTSDSPPQREMLGAAGVFVSPGDPHALARTLAALAVDRPRVESLRRAAFEKATTSFRSLAVVKPLTASLEVELESPRRQRLFASVA
jgi:glycosyltransferase involved in cell wall biosynthesis